MTTISDASVEIWSGRTQRSKNLDIVNIADYGAIGDGVLHTLSEKYSTLEDAQVDYPHATSLSNSIDWAAIQKALNTDIYVDANEGLFIINKPLNVGTQLREFNGRGVGDWDGVYHNRLKTWQGTNLIFTELEKTKTISGITSQQVSGGWRPDQSDSNIIYKLSSFMNDDGSTSPQAFSYGLSFNLNTQGGALHQTLKNMRFVPAIGEDFYSDYNTSGDSLGADIDIGILRLNTEYNNLENIQIVGYWRKAALADVQTAQGIYGRGERNVCERVTLQGFCGLLERASDLHPIIKCDSNSFSIPYFSENYFNGNETKKVNIGTLASTYTYTSTTINETDGYITFNGVEPEITTDITGMQLRSIYRGTGKAGTKYSNMLVYGLNHKSGKDSITLGFDNYSRAHEAHGWPLRGSQYFDFKCQMTNDEKLSAFYGNMTDAQFYGAQHEVGRVIATPAVANQTWVTHATFDTRAIRMYSWIASDKEMFLPRSFYDDQELFSMSDLSGYFKISLPKSMPTQVIKNTSLAYYHGTTQIGAWNADSNLEISNNIVFKGNSSKLSFSGNAYFQANSLNSLTIYGGSGTIAPGRGTNTQSLGSSSESWLSVYAKRYMSTSQVGVIFGEGQPEGSITAAVGSLYLRTDGSAGKTLYVKEIGTGNTGWVAK